VESCHVPHRGKRKGEREREREREREKEEESHRAIFAGEINFVAARRAPV